jgi:mono/diheme cytochrome c family protein
MAGRYLCISLVSIAILMCSCAGEDRPVSVAGILPLDTVPQGNPVAGARPNPAMLAEGKNLYQEFNCAGCHAGGGGAIGPALTDDEWIYGSSPRDIFLTIVQGRPQGMPAWGTKIQETQVWKIVAYVQSLSEPRDRAAAKSPEDNQPGPDPKKSEVSRGREVFETGPCALCHTIRGTRALATIGPDLTHVASRQTIVGTLPNTRGNLAGWILNPQNLKPGTKMPPTALRPADMDALLSYLESLK